MVRRVFRLGAILALLLLLTVALSFSDSSYTGSSLRVEGDLNEDGITEEYTLTDHVLTIKEGTLELWTSPQDYHIDSFALGDVDNDGKANLVISLWKKGCFGKIRPFWHTGEDRDYKNHLFVYELQGNTLKTVWCSSDLDRPILSFDIRDAKGDSLNELVVKEGEYKKIGREIYSTDPNSSVRTTVWMWKEWGFYLCDSKNKY